MSSIPSYQTHIETLSNRVMALSHNFHLSCFIFGLKPHTRPINFMQVVDLTKLQEEIFSKLRKHQRTPYTSNSFAINL